MDSTGVPTPHSFRDDGVQFVLPAERDADGIENAIISPLILLFSTLVAAGFIVRRLFNDWSDHSARSQRWF